MARVGTVFARGVGGYAAPMSDETPESQPGPKPGPPNPEAGGPEAATPPGGPQRQDGSAHQATDGHDDDVSGSPTANQHASESGGHTIDLEDEQPGPDAAPGDDTDDLQEENAETSMDQPSEG